MFLKCTSLKNAICDAAAFLGDRKTLTKKDTKRAIFVEADCFIGNEGFIPLKAEGPVPEEQMSRVDLDDEFRTKLKPYHKIGVNMNESLVRVGSGTSDLRYRPMLWSWTADVTLTYSRYSPELVLTLLAEAGNGGVGENRPTSPQSTGEYGRFEIV